MNFGKLCRILTAVAVVLASWAARAQVQLPALFSDNMVLQQGMPVPVWGWADEGDVVTIKFRNQKVTAKTQNLRWQARLRSLKAGGPDDLVISTKQGQKVLKNVLVGEVWVCSGQSNMEFPLQRAFESEAAIASATNAQIRFFKVPKNRQETPTILVNSAWETLSPETAPSFSAVGYYFGRALQQARNVPVGLIGTYWGGTPAEAWTSRPALELNQRYRAEILEPRAAAYNAYREAASTYEREKTAAQKEGKAFKKRAPRQPWAGAELYNGMIVPLLPYAIKGAIWYQGEANARRAEQYRTLLPDMIRCWRRSWNEPAFPFLLVQLAPYKLIKEEPGDSDWAELRDAQLLATKVLPKVGMAVITDIGEEKNIHPPKKEPVGSRLALAARAIAYGEKIEYSGPVFKAMQVKDNKAVLSFDHVGGGLEARGGDLEGFTICGPDRKFVRAQARIAGDEVVVSSPEVLEPVAVRFGWADYPVVNFWNKAGLPATPFRTDDFPLTTAPK